jgi:hypothetical protein
LPKITRTSKLNLKTISSLELRLAALAEWAENHQKAGLIAYQPDEDQAAVGVLVIPTNPSGSRRELVSLPAPSLADMPGDDIAMLLLKHFSNTGVHLAAAVQVPRNIVLMTTEPADDLSLDLASRFGSVVDDAVTFGEDHPIVTDATVRAASYASFDFARAAATRAEIGETVRVNEKGEFV